MIKGLTTAGIGKIDGIEQMVELASKHGFGAVDADGKSLAEWIEKKGLDAARHFLKDHQVQIASIGLSAEWRKSEEDFRKGLSQLIQDAEAAASLGCNACCTYILPATDLNAAHFMALATRRLRICAEILGAYQIRLGLEFVGPHHLRTAWKNPFIWDQQSTLDWIDAINMPNVGLLFDAYHWYTTHSTVEDIHALKASQIVHVHINDAPDVPIPEALDNGRLYPGEGVINLTAFLKALKHIGYTGAVSQEILTAEPPKGSAEELVKKSAAAFDKVFKAAGL
jgi:sugar phosphate isomerase/epimerase